MNKQERPPQVAAWKRPEQPLKSGFTDLKRKGVKSHGIREWRGRLVIPVYNSSGRLQSLQFISPDGSKRFLSGGKLNGVNGH